jgi:uncharacterized protein
MAELRVSKGISRTPIVLQYMPKCFLFGVRQDFRPAGNDYMSEEQVGVATENAETHVALAAPSSEAVVAAPIPAKPYPGFWQAVRLMLLVILFQIVMGIPVMAFKLDRHPLSLAAIVVIPTFIVAARGLKKSRVTFREMFPFRPINLSTLFPLILAILGLWFLVMPTAVILTRLRPPSREFMQVMNNIFGGRQSFWQSFVLAVLLAPFAEEFLFRGVILYGFLKRYNVIKAIWGSAILFALMHGNLWQMPIGLCLGVFLGWCFAKARSLTPCIIAHAFNNSLSVAVAALQMKSPSHEHLSAPMILWPYLLLSLIGLIIAVPGIYLLKRAFDNTHPAPSSAAVQERQG